MAVYRFRVCFEDKEDIYRDIEIKPAQHFEHFHTIIQSAIGFDGAHPASFFTSDDYWRKEQEIVLREEMLPTDDDDDHPRKKKVVKKLMKNARLADFIEDPHQKFVYVFDPKANWTLLVELIKILPDDPKAEYPRVVKSNGAAPKQYKKAVILPPVAEEEEIPEDKHAPEKVFQEEEGYDEHDEADEDPLIEGDKEVTEGEEEGEEGNETGEDEDVSFDPGYDDGAEGAGTNED